MTNVINSASSASNIYAAALGSNTVALSPGSIMLLLRRRMSDMDGQIDHMMTELESNTSRSEFYQQRTEAMTTIKSAMANQQPDGAEAVKLGDIHVTWNGEDMNAAQLLNRLGIDDAPFASVNANRSTEQLQDLRTEILSDLEDARAAFPDNNYYIMMTGSLRGRLAEVNARLAQGGGFAHYDTVTGDSLDSYIQTLQSQGRRMNSGNEVLMVQMQSAMQQRSQAVTMATQMMKSINDSASQVAQNIGR